ncbi:MAG: hypothetical protein LC776_05405, partial [Acidobacteria bacterium]|nr:hypothetical protein [Acidobacteriota bacterium]
FSHLHEVYSGSDYTSRLHDFSATLDEVARQALRDAVDTQPARYYRAEALTAVAGITARAGVPVSQDNVMIALGSNGSDIE